MAALHGRSPVTVGLAEDADDELVEAFARLVPQLSRSTPPPGAARVAQLVSSPVVDQYVARDGPGGQILGLATLVVVPIPTGRRAWIEDVVVDAAARGRGAGEALVRAMVERARTLGCTTVDLTSRPSREAANRLYLRVGFELRDTNVYRKVLEAE